MTILVVIVYFPTFWGGFILDDRPLIEKNPYIRTLHSPISFFVQEDGVTDKFDAEDYHTGYYRPLINLTYSIDYKLWGLSAPGFRATNLFLHLICCFVLFHFLKFLVNDRCAALWATLIFAVHPVNTETVSWIAARNNILVTMFSVFSLFFYIKGWEEGRILNRVASVLTFALAILSKEMGLMVIPMFFLYQRLLSRTKRNVYEEVLSYLPFIMIAVGYFFLRKVVTASYLSPSEMAGFWNRVCFAPYVVLWNLRLIFVPYGLHSLVVDYPLYLFKLEVFGRTFLCWFFSFVHLETEEKQINGIFDTFISCGFVPHSQYRSYFGSNVGLHEMAVFPNGFFVNCIHQNNYKFFKYISFYYYRNILLNIGLFRVLFLYP